MTQRPLFLPQRGARQNAYESLEDEPWTADPASSVTGARRILLVEDDATLARIFGRALLAAGFVVDHAADGVEALARVASQDYDAVMSDVGMPRLSGLKVLEHVRSAQPDLPVILLTARLDAATYGRARDLGSLRYLLKPVSIFQLVRAAESAVTLRAALRRTRARRSERP
jgi:DNA-binding response OmpR family regulator